MVKLEPLMDSNIASFMIGMSLNMLRNEVTALLGRWMFLCFAY